MEESFRCLICKKPATDKHHVIFRSKGKKSNNPDNIIYLCRKCHGLVHGRNAQILEKLCQLIQNH